jgi:hypothetical protein
MDEGQTIQWPKGEKTNDLQNTGQKTKDGTTKHRGEQMLHNGK